MAKNTVYEWDATAANNTDIAGINIQGSAAVSNFDNALRTVMAQIKSGVDYKQVYAVKTGSYTALAIDNNAFHNFTGATPTLSLTAAATLGANWHYSGYASGGPVIIDPNASELINGATTITVPQYCNFAIICDGSAFFCLVDAAQGYVDQSINQNFIINPDMSVAQRATTYALTTTPAYGSVDRWAFNQASAASGIANQVAATGLTGFRYCLKLGRNSGSTGTGAIAGMQAFLTADSIPLAGKTVTLTGWVKAGANFSGSGGYFTPQVLSGTGTDQSVAQMAAGTWTGWATAATNVTVTTSWVRFSFTTTVSASATQVGVYFSYTPTGTAGADDNLYITGLELKIGSAASQYQFKPASQILSDCQFFCRPITCSARILATSAGQATEATVGWPQMRTTPGQTLLAAGTSNLLTSASLVISTNYGGRFLIISSGAGDSYSGDRRYLLDAEL